MVDVVIRELLGNWGEMLLDMYLKYSLIINSILLLYVVLVILSRRNYDLILNSLINDLDSRYQNKIRKKELRRIEEVLKTVGIPWEEALKISNFPFLTPPRRISLHVKSKETLQRLISIETLATHLGQQHEDQKNIP